jgi:hypothetical protein
VFYEALGLTFTEEQHGAGPVHFACEQEGFVIELYPGVPAHPLARQDAGALMLGFQVAALAVVIANLRSQTRTF